MPINKFHFGSESYLHYTDAPHDQEREINILRAIRQARIGLTVWRLEHNQKISYGVNAAMNRSNKQTCLKVLIYAPMWVKLRFNNKRLWTKVEYIQYIYMYGALDNHPLN